MKHNILQNTNQNITNKSILQLVFVRERIDLFKYFSIIIKSKKLIKNNINHKE